MADDDLQAFIRGFSKVVALSTALQNVSNDEVMTARTLLLCDQIIFEGIPDEDLFIELRGTLYAAITIVNSLVATLAFSSGVSTDVVLAKLGSLVAEKTEEGRWGGGDLGER